MSKGLEALELLGNETVVVKNIKTIFMEGINDDAYSYLTLTQVKNINQGCYDIIEKELKALEIIKKCRIKVEKREDFDVIGYATFRKNGKYRYYINDIEITQEEYDLLEEVLCNDKI